MWSGRPDDSYGNTCYLIVNFWNTYYLLENLLFIGIPSTGILCNLSWLRMLMELNRPTWRFTMTYPTNVWFCNGDFDDLFILTDLAFCSETWWLNEQSPIKGYFYSWENPLNGGRFSSTPCLISGWKATFMQHWVDLSTIDESRKQKMGSGRFLDEKLKDGHVQSISSVLTASQAAGCYENG